MVPRARGFGMDVTYWNRTRLDVDREVALGVRYVELTALLDEARFVSIHVASTPETHHLIDAAALARLGPDGYLINTARGDVVDEHALVDALRRGVIRGAGLDVFEREPALTDGLRDLPNVTLAPHLGSATHDARTAMGMLAVENLAAVLRGERPRHVVNPAVFDSDGE